MRGASAIFFVIIMVSEVGIDIVDTKRFSDYSDRSDSHLSKWFTDDELDYCFRRNPPSNGLAGKFAAKEAVVKILTERGINISHLKEIEILNDKNGKPFVNSSLLAPINDKIKISISHDGGFAIAIAIMDK